MDSTPRWDSQGRAPSADAHSRQHRRFVMPGVLDELRSRWTDRRGAPVGRGCPRGAPLGSATFCVPRTLPSGKESVAEAFPSVRRFVCCTRAGQQSAPEPSLRDKGVAHFDQDQPFIDSVPDFDPALQTASVYQEWARDLISPVLLGQPTRSSLYKQWRESAAAMPSSSVIAPRNPEAQEVIALESIRQRDHVLSGPTLFVLRAHLVE